DNFSTGDIGKYFSALSNEANLKNAECAWLVFGIEDKTKNIVGTSYRSDQARLNGLKKQIADNTTNNISFVEIYSVSSPERVVMFCIPPTPRGIPLAWKGHYYARDGESLTFLNLEKIERIRRQAISEDWSKGICVGATIDDLDEKAILKARELFKKRYPADAAKVDEWNDITFLNKSKATIQGKITRTAIILLGKPESEHFISPAVAKIRWILKDSKGNEKDYLIKSCPFILTVDEVFSKMRNVIYRLEKRETLYPDEMEQYSPDLIYEAINNCIAHQDYSLKGRINVVEKEDEIIFTNYGDFIPGSIENVIIKDAPEERYRNDFLCSAMFNFRMVQTRGGGIRMMFNEQARRFFPLPEYDFSNSKVKVTVIGKVLDMDYASVLARYNELTLEEIMMLDKVQKKKKLTQAEFKHLKKKGLIEGVRPNIFISAKVAQKTGQKATYTKFKAFDNSYYQDLIVKALKEHTNLTRTDFDELIWDKLSDGMTDEQKKRKIGNLLSELRIKGIIKNTGSDFKPIWILS
ncbi:MAG: putative DNA binding domain-containing protein, partial [Nitrosopumilus sp.]|nr:putative DNA binding domain-containing protein [Nitrosopumilus sp.]